MTTPFSHSSGWRKLLLIIRSLPLKKQKKDNIFLSSFKKNLRSMSKGVRVLGAVVRFAFATFELNSMRRFPAYPNRRLEHGFAIQRATPRCISRLRSYPYLYDYIFIAKNRARFGGSIGNWEMGAQVEGGSARANFFVAWWRCARGRELAGSWLAWVVVVGQLSESRSSVAAAASDTIATTLLVCARVTRRKYKKW